MMILVTGAPGNVGTDLVHLLQAEGPAFRVGARRPERAQAILGEGVETVRFDFEDPTSFAGALAGVSRIFLVRPPQLADVPKQILPFLEAARTAGVEQVVFLSVMGADTMPFLPHAKIEKWLMASGMAWTMLRPTFFMQNLSTTYRQMIRETGEIALPVGKGRMSYIDCRDIAGAALATLKGKEHWNKGYTLAEEAYSYAEIAVIFTRELGREICYPSPSLWRYRRQMKGDGFPAGIINLTSMMYIMGRLGLSAGVTDDLERLLGRTPTSMAQFVRDHAELWMPR